jgi:hypothetical protein
MSIYTTIKEVIHALLSQDVFKSLVKKEILLMEDPQDPAIKCAVSVHKVLIRMVGQNIQKHRFDRLNKLMCCASVKVLDTQLKVTKKAIKEHMKIETGMISTLDAEFTELLKVLLLLAILHFNVHKFR